MTEQIKLKKIMNSRDKVKNVHSPLKSIREEVQEVARRRLIQLVKFQILDPRGKTGKTGKTEVNRSNLKGFRRQEKKKNEKRPCSLEENRR